MKIGNKIAAAGLSALALTGGLLSVGTDLAHASTTGNGGQVVGWQPDPNSLGDLYFYNAAGKQITSGSVTDTPMALYYVASGTGAKSGQVRTTTPTLANSATWAGTQSSTSTQTFPAANLPGDLAGFTGAVIKDDSQSSFKNNQILGFPNNLTDTGYANLYEVRMYTDNASAVNKWFAADIFVNPTTGAWNQVYPNQTTPTVTLVSSKNPATTGDTITLSATLGTALAGSVKFFEGTTQVGTILPVTTTNSTASTPVTPTQGSHIYRAEFTPTPGTAGLAATSGNVTEIVVAPATATTIAFVSQNVGVYANDPASFVFHVSAADSTNPAGTVVFKDGATTLGNGTQSTTTPGDYSLTTSALGASSHTISAQFLSADTSKYTNSNTASGTAFTYGASPTVGPADPQDIKTTVVPGIVTITTPYTPSNVYDLGTLGLNPTATLLVNTSLFPATGDNPITITDLRSGNLPWHATLIASDLKGTRYTTSDPSSYLINGQNLGFAPSAATYPTGNALTGKVDVVTQDPAAGVGPSDGGIAGLKSGYTFAKVQTGASGVGTAFIRGNLTMQAPTSTKADVYRGILTFTVIGS